MLRVYVPTPNSFIRRMSMAIFTGRFYSRREMRMLSEQAGMNTHSFRDFAQLPVSGPEKYYWIEQGRGDQVGVSEPDAETVQSASFDQRANFPHLCDRHLR